jgi:hypothetical protein
MLLNIRERRAQTKIRAPGSNTEGADKLYSYREERCCQAERKKDIKTKEKLTKRGAQKRRGHNTSFFFVLTSASCSRVATKRQCITFGLCV